MTKSRFAPHQKGILKWCGRHAEWFWRNSHREYRLTTISIRQMENLAGSHGIFAGCATACKGGAKPNTSGRGLHVEPDFPHTSMRGPRSLPCIVRRPDLAQGRPLPEVFLLDGMTVPSAPPNGAPAPDVDEEAFCAAWWGHADALRAMGLVLRWQPSEIDWSPDYGGLNYSVEWRSEVPLGASVSENATAKGRLISKVRRQTHLTNKQ